MQPTYGREIQRKNNTINMFVPFGNQLCLQSAQSVHLKEFDTIYPPTTNDLIPNGKLNSQVSLAHKGVIPSVITLFHPRPSIAS